MAASVSPPPAMENAGAARDRLRQRARAFAELIELEHADRAVPDDRAGVAQHAREALGRVRADVEDHLVGGDVADRLHVGFGVRRELLRDDHVGRQRNLDLELRGLLEQALRDVDHLRLDQRLADAVPCRGEERVGDAAADDQLVDLASRLSSTVSLVETFEPATIAISGRFGFSSAVSSAISSFISSGPAQATFAKRATPCVLASARCAVPNASIT